MNVGNVFFALCGIAALVGALCTVIAKNPIRGAMGLLLTIVGIAGLFLKLNAQFLAAIQLIVYAGAVVVLFVFVIMLLGPDAGHAKETSEPKAKLARALAGVLMALISLVTLGLVLRASDTPQRFGHVGSEHGSVEAVGRQLFTKAVVPFELATALLIVAVVGAIAVARSRHQTRKEKQSPSPTRRFFHGPLHPRDAGRPLTGEEL
ncbi:MAG TPA: NADH-quinone oxidoreductase subunit J [Polyangiaceae bacterium]|nr:NADH-quinone oxidoreductase subunit J [Polyangiaceae bacterium]